MRNIASIARRAESRFSNFNGGGRGYGRYGYMNKSNYTFNFNSANANPNAVNPVDRTLFVTITNSNTGTSSFILFNTFVDRTDANLPSGVTITVAGSSHTRVKEEIGSNPFLIYGMKYNVSAAAQFDNELTLRYQNGTGSDYNNIWVPRTRISAQNESSTDIDAPDFVFPIDGHTAISSTINGSATIRFTFFLMSKTSLQNALQGQNVVQSTQLPPPTGHVLADIELMQRHGALG